MQLRLLLGILLPLLAGSTLIGRALTARVPLRVRGVCRLYLSPVLGAAILVCMSILHGWLTGGGGRWLPVLLFTLAAAAGFALDPSRRGVVKHLVLVCAFGALASWPVSAQLWRFQLINPFNDTFTYLGHSQWLQEHSFREPANPDYHPLWTQVVIYQKGGFRMGASFFLAWVQRMAGLKWALDAFPVTVAFAVALASLGLAGGLAVAARAKPAWALAGGLLLAWTLNGLSYAAIMGFFAQSHGLAFGITGLLLWGMVLERCGRGGAPLRGRLRWLAVLAGLSLAVSAHAYTELVPFVGFACFASWLWALAVCRKARGSLGQAALHSGGVVFLLVNLEWIRAFQGILAEAHALVGAPLPWNALEFWIHSAGWKEGLGDGKISFVPFPWLAAAAACGFLGTAAYAIARQLRRRGESLVLVPHMAFFSILLAAFFYYRYGVPSPWPVGTGQSFSQFKLCEWASPSFILIAWSVLFGAAWKLRAARGALAAVLAVLLALGVCVQFQKAQERISMVLKSGGRNFAAFRRLEADARATVRPGETVYLNSAYVKPKQIAALFLYRFQVVGDWSKDDYVYPYITETLRGIPFSSTDWVVDGGKRQKGTQCSWSFLKGPVDALPEPPAGTL